MIVFKEIEINNFASIDHFRMVFNKGIYSINGMNMSGKTTLLMAIIQCLYNRNPKYSSDKIEETYNKITGKPYKITIFFNKNGVDYKVVNDREKNRIDIFKEGVNIAPKGIKQQLLQIEKIIGMSYSVFSSFFYLSVTTLQNIFDVTNENNLIYKFFDIDTLKELEVLIRSDLNENKKELRVLNITKNSIDKQINTISNFNSIDKEKLLKEKQLLQESLLELLESNDVKKIKLLQAKENELKNKIGLLIEDIRKLEGNKEQIEKFSKKFKNGICPVCESDVTNKKNHLQKELDDLNSNINELKKEYKELKEQKNNIVDLKNELELNIETKKKDLQNKINKIETKIIVYEQEEKNFKALQENLETLKTEKESIELKINSIEKDILIQQYLMSIFKSNVVAKKYLQNFIFIYNKKIQELVELLEYENKIIAYYEKGKIAYKFIYKDIEKSLNSLSSGEKTRASLIILFAILETLFMLSDTKINILALDEIMGVLDKKGVELLKKLLNKYRNEYTIFLIQHHEEIEKQFFDYKMNVKKINGLSVINIEENENVQ